ncbi:TonB-dependent receptor [Burkholderia gladioli]|uniref:TonB-dependent receptor n=1 Tax=Burkholderia gladioli TaxID=28095 RepID=UPI00163FC80F|nr:TonB-dependent siderophore receptor [Burkholderia gladioli]MDN7754848.1 TonB-dependent siderophore receptor [Burkholderia gladioli]
MRTIETLRPVISGIAASTSLAGGLFFVASPADAQEAGQAPQPAVEPEKPAEQLPTIKIEGRATTNALQKGTGLNRLPDDLQSTPQTVTVIPHVVIEQQQATTVDQVLKYVPGVTVSTGEGGGGITGDQFRIRGFDASGDIFVDGLRDFGSYVRDSFDIENVQVLKGSSSESFGNGTTGGAIELDTKKAHLGNAGSVEATGGSGPYGRAVLDVNRQLNDTTAVRVVGMGSSQDIVDRDHVFSSRAGILASVGFGLGTSQTVTVNYFHQSSNQRPDFGVPMLNAPSGIGEPVTEYGVPRSNYFGRQSDHDRQDADVVSVMYKGKFGDWLTLTNDTRFGYYTRDVKFTPTFCNYTLNGCAADVLAGNLNAPYYIWAVGGTRQRSYGGENLTTARMRFETAGFEHELVAGLDVYSQRAKTAFYLPVGPEPAGTLLNPIFQNSPGFSDVLSPTNQTTATSWDFGPFISDRMWLTPQISILGGVRWDHYDVSGTTSGTPFKTTTNFASPKAALIWEPTGHQTYYFSFSRSFTPPGNNITSLSSPLGLSEYGTLSGLKPEGDTTLEIGGKWSVLDDRLGLTAALFRTRKSNASYTDPTLGIQTTTDDTVRVQGVELGVTGQITRDWDVQASYAYMDSKILESSISAFNPTSAAGNRVPYVSKQAASLWTTYDVASLLHNLPGHLRVGGGVNWRSDYYVNDAMTLRIPAATTIDAMVSYDVSDYHFALNVTNLTNALAYSSAFANGYATPVAGRTVTLTAGLKF